MGHNPRFARWRSEDWQGYAPTIGRMVSRGWTLTGRCPACRLDIKAEGERIIAVKGRDWSPWGKTAPCPKLHCRGRMHLRAYDFRSNCFIDI